MHRFFVSRSAIVRSAFAVVPLLVACQDKRVRQLDTGITRDSVLSVISKDLKPRSGVDSFPNVYTRDRYLIGGKNYEVLYFTPNNAKKPVAASGLPIPKDTVPLKKLTPLVFVDNKLIGRGWAFWDSVSTANKIPLKER